MPDPEQPSLPPLAEPSAPAAQPSQSEVIGADPGPLTTQYVRKGADPGRLETKVLTEGETRKK